MKIKVGVLMGGKSSEYEISLMTGKNVINFLDTGKYSPIRLILTKDNKWTRNGKKMPVAKALNGIDVVFNAMHGEYGEDGRIQGILDFYKMPYTGSGVLASALGMDKIRSRKLFANLGIMVPKYLCINKKDYGDKSVLKNIRKLGRSGVVIKPNACGSSVGIQIIKGSNLNDKNIISAINKAFKFDSEVVIEEYLEGQEVTCGVLEKWNSQDYFTLPLTEIIPKDSSEFFDYDAKYSSKTQEITPAKISKTFSKKIQEITILAHKTIKARGYSRSDFIIKGKKIYLLEINTLPGLTEESLLPKASKVAGIDFPKLLNHIIKLAFR